MLIPKLSWVWVVSDHFSMKFLKWGPEKSNLGRDLESERPLMLHQLKRTPGPLGHMQHKSYVMERNTQTHIETQHKHKRTLGPLGHMQHKLYVMEKHTQTHIETQHQLKRTLCFLPLGHIPICSNYTMRRSKHTLKHKVFWFVFDSRFSALFAETCFTRNRRQSKEQTSIVLTQGLMRDHFSLLF